MARHESAKMGGQKKKPMVVAVPDSVQEPCDTGR
jgi:hypothetical protein